MKTCTIRLSYTDFADEVPNNFSNLPEVISLIRTGGRNSGQIDSNTYPLFKA